MKNETEKSAIEVGVQIIYDSVHAGQRAKELCDRVQRRLGSGYDLNLTLWNLAVLRIPGLSQAAIEAATQPGLLLFALNGNESLPPFVRTWASRYVRKRQAVRCAIVVLFYGIIRMGLILAPAYGELKQIADEAGLDFLATVVEPPDADLSQCINEIHENANMRTSILEIIPQQH